MTQNTEGKNKHKCKEWHKQKGVWIYRYIMIDRGVCGMF